MGALLCRDEAVRSQSRKHGHALGPIKMRLLAGSGCFELWQLFESG